MPDTDRLYALSSTHNHPLLPDIDGPGLLIDDAVVAMRWYLTHEREEYLAVAGHVSDDSGATWKDLPPGELFADAARALMERAQAPGRDEQRIAALLGDALAAEAADWLDHRIRYVQPDDPVQYRPQTPTLSAWRRGGQIWALALGTVPDEAVLARLTAQYADPQPEGPEQLHAGAAATLGALALAEDPSGADVTELLGALGHMNRLTFGIDIGQLLALAEAAQQSIMDHLVTRHPATAFVAEAHPDPQHPSQQAARAYLRRLSLIGIDGEERLLTDAAHAFVEALAEAEAVQHPATAAPDTATPEPAAVPGYPKHLEGDLQAAAQWRLISPAARRAADRAMAGLVHAATRLTEASAAADPERPAGRQESQAMRQHTDRYQELDELNARHALLMHASVMADAEAAGVTAGHDAIVAAAQATEDIRARPRTTSEMRAGHETFMAQVNAAEDRIAHTLGVQRQLTRDALHRLFPQTFSRSGLHQLRTQLIDHSGLGLDAYKQAWHAIGDTARTLESLKARYRSGTVEPGRPPVTAKQVEQARTAAHDADRYFDDLQRSRPLTLRAVKALDGVTGLEPSSPDSIAARAAKITAQSRQRALPSTAAAAHPRRGASTDQQAQHTAHLQTPSNGPGYRP